MNDGWDALLWNLAKLRTESTEWRNAQWRNIVPKPVQVRQHQLCIITFPSLSPQCWLCATARGHKAPVCKSHRCNRGDPSRSTMPSSGASWGGKKTPVKSAIQIPPSSSSQCHCWFSDQQHPNPTNCHVPAILSITPSMHLPIQCNVSINSGGTVPTSCMYPWVSWGLKKNERERERESRCNRQKISCSNQMAAGEPQIKEGGCNISLRTRAYYHIPIHDYVISTTSILQTCGLNFTNSEPLTST